MHLKVPTQFRPTIPYNQHSSCSRSYPVDSFDIICHTHLPQDKEEVAKKMLSKVFIKKFNLMLSSTENL